MSRILASTFCAAVLCLLSLAECLGADLEVVAQLPVCPGNITVTPDNRVIISLHPFHSPTNRVVELTSEGKLVPFPNAAWNRGSGDHGQSFDSVLGVQSDARGVVWMLDSGLRGGTEPKLVGWNTRENRLERIIPLMPPVVPALKQVPDAAFFNDLAVDLTHDTVYIAHSSGIDESALIVIDLKTGTARRLLQGHESVLPEKIDLVMDGRSLNFTLPDAGRLKMLIGVNAIALDASNEWLYYGPMMGDSLYRVRTADLIDMSLSPDELARRVERYSSKPVCDGISVDNAGNVYVSDLQAQAVGVISPERAYRVLVKDPRISWPESFSFGPDGMLYFVASQLHLSAPLNGGHNASRPPYLVLRVKALAPGVPGR